MKLFVIFNLIPCQAIYLEFSYWGEKTCIEITSVVPERKAHPLSAVGHALAPLIRKNWDEKCSQKGVLEGA